MIDLVIKHWKEVLEADRPLFDSALNEVFENARLSLVLDHFSDNIAASDYPLLMISEGSLIGSWASMPQQADYKVSLSVTGAVHHNDAGVAAKMNRALARQLEQSFNSRHGETDLDDGLTLYHGGDFSDRNTDLPLYSIEFGDARLGSAIVRAFVASYRGRIRSASFDYRQVDLA